MKATFSFTTRHISDLFHYIPVYQCVLNLAGRSDHILDLSRGKAMSYRKRFDWKNNSGEQAEWSYAMQLYCYCDEFERATQMFEKLVSLDIGLIRSYPIWHVRVFFFAIISIHNAKQGKNPKWLHNARQYLGMVERWVVQDKAINMVHKLQILKAEMLTVGRKKVNEKVISLAYDKAIAASTRSGFLQDAAFGAYLASSTVKDEYQQKEYFRRSMSLYRTWGADGVVSHLSASPFYRESILAKGVSGTGHRSRERYDPSILKEQKEISISY